MQISHSLFHVLITGAFIIVCLIALLFFFVVISQRKKIKVLAAAEKLLGDVQKNQFRAAIETLESERKQLAEGLYDGVAQLLSAIKLNLHRLEKTGYNEGSRPLLLGTRNLTDECLTEVRGIIYHLLPPVLIDYGLQQALDGLCVKTEQSAGIEVQYEINVGTLRFKPEIELAIYRIVQDLLSNAVKHLSATSVHLTLVTEPGFLSMEFRENGKGFDIEQIKEGFGLKNLESRIRLLKGEIKIDTRSENGSITAIRIRTD